MSEVVALPTTSCIELVEGRTIYRFYGQGVWFFRMSGIFGFDWHELHSLHVPGSILRAVVAHPDFRVAGK